MLRRSSTAFALVLVLGLMNGAPARGQEGPRVSVEAAALLAEALGVMRAHYYRANEIDWGVVSAEAFAGAAGAEETVDTYGAIRGALSHLSHSFLQLSAEAREREGERRALRGLPAITQASGSDEAPSPFADRRTPEGTLRTSEATPVGHLVVPAFGGGGERATQYATTLQEAVQRLAEAGACRWIIDLRGNGGGNMWPMLVGVGPVLGEGLVGSIEINGRHDGNWFYRDGVSGMDGPGGFIGSRLPGEAVRLDSPGAVAVLIDRGTGSSGEAVAIAFKGRPNTRFFGEPTAGYSTATNGFRLSDGANLVIAVGVDVDREGIRYPAEVHPDERISLQTNGSTTADGDLQMDAAIQWLTARDCPAR